MIDWSQAKDVATVVGAAIALLTLFKGIIEYIKQGAQKRAEQFEGMRRRFKENESFKELCGLLETDDQKLEVISFRDKRDFLGFFEEIALMTNSKIIRKEVAHYMFGYYAIRCWESKHFWKDVNRDSIYWQLFRDFVERMKAIESSFRFTRRNFRF